MIDAYYTKSASDLVLMVLFEKLISFVIGDVVSLVQCFGECSSVAFAIDWVLETPGRVRYLRALNVQE